MSRNEAMLDSVETAIKTYKGFNKDMTCRGFQYEEGKEYETDEAAACKSGFHACGYPLDCFSYYSPHDSVYYEVEQSGKLSKHDEDSKVASTKIKVGAKLDIAGIVKAAIGIARSLIETENLLTFLKADRELFTKVHRLGFDFFKDCVYASLILHDCCKQGLDRKGHTIFEHPLVAVDLFEQCVDELGYGDKEKTKYISSAIGEHMGQWIKSKYSNIELHKPSNGVSYCVHLCDYLASRKFLEFNFDKYEL